MKHFLPIVVLSLAPLAAQQPPPAPSVDLAPPPAVGGIQPLADPLEAAPSGAVDPVFNGVQTEKPVPTPQPLPNPLTAGPTPTPGNPATTVAGVRPSVSLRDLKATVSESRYPDTVRRQGAGYVLSNIPPGWKMVKVKSLVYNPAPTIPLANGETYSVHSAPYVLIPAAEANRVQINPRALQTLHNYYMATEELTNQLKEALKAENIPTRIE